MKAQEDEVLKIKCFYFIFWAFVTKLVTNKITYMKKVMTTISLLFFYSNFYMQSDGCNCKNK